MLKKRDLTDCHILFELITHPEVFPFVRQKAKSYEEFLFLTKQSIEAEQQGNLISRTITDEWGTPIGTINLFDIENNAGFLGTWIGKPYFGKGYNKVAKDAFFHELFFEKNIQSIFMKIRKTNTRSQQAAKKLPYITLANDIYPTIYGKINLHEEIYDLYAITKDQFILHTKREAIQLTPIQAQAEWMEA